MREIKFRAWHKEQNKMYSPEELGRDQLTLMPDGRGFVNISSVDVRLSRVDDNVKMIPLQYTGLKDNHRKEIYEGDIVFLDAYYDGDIKIREMRGTIKFNGGSFVVLSSGDVFDLYRLTEEKVVEVIGNIFEK